MKKLILIVALSLWAVFAFAETGALGFNWGEKYDEKKLENIAIPHKKQKLGRQEKIIIGNNNSVYCFYIYSDKQKMFCLRDIFYTLKNEDLYRLTRNLNHVITWSEASPSTLNELTNEQEIFDNGKSLMIPHFLASVSLLIEYHGESKLSLFHDENDKIKPGTISIYDYNDDTRVYIYENFIEDEAVVVYVPHERDY